jgi:hypothetical protein
MEDIMKLSINVRKLYPETTFYLNWARKSKNIKTKRKLIIKAIKEFKFLSKKDLKRRILRQM